MIVESKFTKIPVKIPGYGTGGLHHTCNLQYSQTQLVYFSRRLVAASMYFLLKIASAISAKSRSSRI